MTETITTSLYELAAGQVTVAQPYAARVVEELPEYSWTSKAASMGRLVASVMQNDRIELEVRVAGKPAALAVVVPEQDDHVGPCLSVQWLYTLPEHRGKGYAESLLQIVKRLAVQLQIPTIAYTRRVGDIIGGAQYQLTYRRVYGKED